MGDSKGASRESIPDIEDIKPAALQVLASGRSRSLASFESETAKRLGLTSAQRAFRVAGSTTALFSNRFEKARSELHREGMIDYPARGKVRLSEAGRAGEKGETKAEQASTQPIAQAESESSASVGMQGAEQAGKENVGTSTGRHVGTERESDRADARVHGGDTATRPLGQSPDTHEKPKSATTGKQVPGHSGSSSFEGGIVAFPTQERSEQKHSSIVALVLAAVGLALSFTGVFSLVGALCGAASLGFFVREKRKNSAFSEPAAPKATLALGICSVVLGVLIALGGAATGTHNEEAQQPPDSPSQQEASPVEKSEEHELSFVVQSDEEHAPASVTVIVSGTQTDGTKVSERHEAAIGKTYTLACSAGRYKFEVDTASLEIGEVLLKADRAECSFDGSKDHTVSIKLVQDAEAMKARAAQEEAERQKAEEEAAAAAAAAAAEQEAAAAAEREAAAAAAAANDGGSDTVYITKTGEKYHRDGCSSLRKSKIPTTRSEAEARGYEPCKNCRP